MPPDPEQPTPAFLVGSAAIFYGIMSAVGIWLLGYLATPLETIVFGGGTTVARDTLIGAGVGLGIVLATWLTRNLEPVKRLNRELGGLLGRPPSSAIAVLAVTSAIGEELFFRGALQGLIGFWPTVVIFGLVHGGLQKRFRAWAIFATLAGIVLGSMADFTTNLLAPILCHMTVNYWNLHALRQKHGAE